MDQNAAREFLMAIADCQAFVPPYVFHQVATSQVVRSAQQIANGQVQQPEPEKPA